MSQDFLVYESDVVVAALGTDGAEIFTLAENLKALLNQCKAGSVDFTPPRTYTENQDGTVTLAAVQNDKRRRSLPLDP